VGISKLVDGDVSMSFPFWEFAFRGLPSRSFAFLPLPSFSFIPVRLKDYDNFYCSDTAPEALSDDMERKTETRSKPDLEERDSEWEEIHEGKCLVLTIEIS